MQITKSAFGEIEMCNGIYNFNIITKFNRLDVEFV